MAQVLERAEFGARHSLWKLKYVGPEPAQQDRPWLDKFLRSIGKALRLVGKWIAIIGRVLAWVGLGVVVLVLLWLLLRHLRLRRGALRRASVPPAEVAGFDIRPESLPEDVAGSALALARAGQARASLSLLYRAALSALAHRDQVEFARGDTEGDCLRRVRTAVPPRYVFFSGLTLAWEEVAYARHGVALERLEELCRQWPTHFVAQT